MVKQVLAAIKLVNSHPADELVDHICDCEKVIRRLRQSGPVRKYSHGRVVFVLAGILYKDVACLDVAMQVRDSFNFFCVSPFDALSKQISQLLLCLEDRFD